MASDVLRYQSETTQWTARLIVYCTFGYLGMMLAMRSNRDEFSLIIPYVRFARETTQHEPLVLDTSVIIDGRIADLCATGFLSRSLIVPRFVLGELQTLADSRDPTKRERGRRGLDILNDLQSSRDVELTVHEGSGGDGDESVDARLVRTAKVLHARLLTNDNALGQVARLQQVHVLNLSDLTRALKPSVTAGDELELNLVKEGREQHQAVGYLADGTMIVVNHARPHLGKIATVIVSSALQTAAGRLIFAELKGNGTAPPASPPDLSCLTTWAWSIDSDEQRVFSLQSGVFRPTNAVLAGTEPPIVIDPVARNRCEKLRSVLELPKPTLPFS